jgi:hypothetical protein
MNEIELRVQKKTQTFLIYWLSKKVPRQFTAGDGEEIFLINVAGTTNNWHEKKNEIRSQVPVAQACNLS